MNYSTLSSLDTRQEIYSFNSGVRWNLPKKPVTPFVGFDLIVNRFSKNKVTAISDTTVIVIGSSTRNESGAMLTGGVGIKLTHAVSVEAEGRYAVDNLFTRKKSEKISERYAIDARLVYHLKP